MDTGARGNISNFFNLPVCVVWWPLLTGRSWNCLINFREGLSVLEMFFITVRKGMTDTFLAQPIQVTLLVVWRRCPKMLLSVKMTVKQTVVFLSVRLLMVKKLRKHLKNVFKVSHTKKSVKNPTTGEVIVVQILWLLEDMAAAIVKVLVLEGTVRSVFLHVTHVTVSGRHCYGINLATDAVEAGSSWYYRRSIYRGNRYSLLCVPSTPVG